MYRNEATEAEELLDSTAGLHGLPGAPPRVWSQPWVQDGRLPQAPQVPVPVPFKRDVSNSERPSKRLKLDSPVPTASSHYPGAVGFPAQSMIFSPSARGDFIGNDASLDTSYRNASEPHLLTAAPISPSVSRAVPQPRPPPSKHRRESVLREGPPRPQRESPFKDSIGTVGLELFHTRGFSFKHVAEGNRVSSYLKFNVPKKSAQQPVGNHLVLRNQGNIGPDQQELIAGANHMHDVFGRVAEDPFANDNGISWSDGMPMAFTLTTSTDMSMPAMVYPHQSTPRLSFSSSFQEASFSTGQLYATVEEHEQADAERRMEQARHPAYAPDQFGSKSKLTGYQRKFNDFYIKVWCPGRTILMETNLWLRDFAPMCDANEHIRDAMVCLAGVYIYDYTSAPLVREHTNMSFQRAERRLTELLNKSHLDADEANEAMTITVLLSMQDIVFVERRKRNHERTRWLEGFKECEKILQDKDPRERFWDAAAATETTRNDRNIQLDSLQLSLSICVYRNVILAQPLMPLPDARVFDQEKEMRRFGWLLTGNEDDMFAIHGGCGFSKMLLHQLSQVTLLAAMTRQAGTDTYSDEVAEVLLDGLLCMRQFSKESGSVRNTWKAAKQQPPIIDWVRQQIPESTRLDRDGMTDVTAEAWRFAVMIYLQCRALRLPRDHPEVMSKMDDLASCIRIMPTSGPLFTAQAPLLPVFLLGALAVDPRHKELSQRWFYSVVSAPVRSSVPPLFDALQDIWKWIDKEVPLGQQPCDSVARRDPWWERLVAVVKKTQKETLCLT